MLADVPPPPSLDAWVHVLFQAFLPFKSKSINQQALAGGKTGTWRFSESLIWRV